MAVLNSYQGYPQSPRPTGPQPMQQQQPAVTPASYAKYYGGNSTTAYTPSYANTGAYANASNQPYNVKGPGPNEGAIILGDSMKGAQAGSSYGGPYGAVAGGVIGAGLGFMDYDNARQQYEALNKAADEATKVNNARQNAMLSTSDQARMDQTGALNEQYRQMFNMAAMQGTAPQLSREQQFTNQQLGQSKNDAISRGLYNSTTLGNTQRGIQDDSQRRQQEINQQDLQNQLALRQQYTNQLVPIAGQAAQQKIGIITNATVQGPNAAQYAQYYASAGGQGPYGNALSQANNQSSGSGGGGMGGIMSMFGGMF